MKSCSCCVARINTSGSGRWHGLLASPKKLKPNTSQISCMYSAPAHSSIAALVLERQLHFHTVGKRLPRFDVDVLIDNAVDPNFPLGLRSPLDGCSGRVLLR